MQIFIPLDVTFINPTPFFSSTSFYESLQEIFPLPTPSFLSIDATPPPMDLSSSSLDTPLAPFVVVDPSSRAPLAGIQSMNLPWRHSSSSLGFYHFPTANCCPRSLFNLYILIVFQKVLVSMSLLIHLLALYPMHFITPILNPENLCHHHQETATRILCYLEGTPGKYIVIS